ncbi:MAG: CoA transferase [Rhodospirillaceae bacterium]|nr:MAG: CoA transferase [Rhodospirillaceae bacterium]
MTRPLEGIKVVEVAMWAFVPAAGGMLSDMGANVIKIEPPTGDPLRGLKIAALGSDKHGFVVSWENYNRGKRSITLDLRREEGREVLYKLLEDADVFLTNLLPRARRKMKIDIDDIRARFPKIIYAVGSGSGRRGPEGEKGGFDSITYWARSGISSSTTPEDADFPVGLPGAAFGDCASAAMLAGGVAAAIAQRALTGHSSVVDVSLLAAGMWSMQRGITQAALDGVERFPRPERNAIPNVLVNVYKTKDGRFLSLCMLQAQRYWAAFCEAAGRPDLAADPRFNTDASRVKNAAACIAELDALFLSRPLAEWREILAKQEGQWDVVQHVGELKDDRQVKANGYMQPVDYGDGRIMEMVSIPMQFDGAPLPARPAPELGADSEAILQELGYDWGRIIELKDAGVIS